MKKHLSAEGNFTEPELEEYMQSHKKLMIDSLWKLNVADIEATLSRVCQMVVFTIPHHNFTRHNTGLNPEFNLDDLCSLL